MRTSSQPSAGTPRATRPIVHRAAALSVALISLLMPGMAAAQADYQAGRDLIAAETNGSGLGEPALPVNGVWTYGKSFAGSGTFLPLSNHSDAAQPNYFEAGEMQGWDEPSLPLFAANVSGEIVDGGVLGAYDPGTIVIHPSSVGSNGAWVVVRWTAPQAGTVDLGAAWVLRQIQTCPAGDGVTFYVRHNGGVLGTDVSVPQKAPYDFVHAGLAVAGGDTVDFITGPGPNNHFCNATQFDARVSYVSAGDPPADDLLYVIERGAGQELSTVDSSGAVTLLTDNLSNPLFVARLANGNLVVTERGKAKLTEIDPSTGAVLRLVSPGHNPNEVLVEAETLWVTTFNNRLLKSANGLDGPFVTVVSGFPAEAFGPIRVDGALYVAAAGRLYRIDGDDTSGYGATEVKSGLGHVLGLIEFEGDILTSDYGGGLVRRSDLADTSLSGGITTFASGLPFASSFTAADDGGVIVSQQKALGRLVHISSDGTVETIVESSELSNPRGVLGNAEVTTTQDADGDGLADEADNCPADPNADQADLDNDGLGDACDPDVDGDGVNNDDDNCKFIANHDQADTDADGVGDACNDADDADGDEWVDDLDNCPVDPNPGQADLDNDLIGDACDPDVDGDGVDNGADNCEFDANPGQADTDANGLGDACNDGEDVDGDEWANDLDNCPVDPNPGQADLDNDAIGDACDADVDGDGTDNGADNCPWLANANQTDTDGNGIGDACNDADDADGDEWSDGLDNCPADANGDQQDFDGDGQGDVCDADVDGDGTANADDQCPATPADEVSDPANGCTVAQSCPCAGPNGSAAPWKNHGKYVSCVSQAANALKKAGLISGKQKGAMVSEASKSSCGK